MRGSGAGHSDLTSNPCLHGDGIAAGGVAVLLAVPAFADDEEEGALVRIRGVMNHNVGVWIDHKRAVIVSASEGRVTARTLQSEVEGHPRYSGQQDGGGEKKYEARHGRRLDQYYDEVIGQLGQPDALLIFGPGEAKLELKERLSRSKTFSERTVDVATADKLTDPQIVAKVKEHFQVDQ